MNHKRRRPKSTRSGCLMCKSHKHQAAKDKFCNQTEQEKRAIVSEAEQRSDLASSRRSA